MAMPGSFRVGGRRCRKRGCLEVRQVRRPFGSAPGQRRQPGTGEAHQVGGGQADLQAAATAADVDRGQGLGAGVQEGGQPALLPQRADAAHQVAGGALGLIGLGHGGPAGTGGPGQGLEVEPARDRHDGHRQAAVVEPREQGLEHLVGREPKRPRRLLAVGGAARVMGVLGQGEGDTGLLQLLDGRGHAVAGSSRTWASSASRSSPSMGTALLAWWSKWTITVRPMLVIRPSWWASWVTVKELLPSRETEVRISISLPYWSSARYSTSMRAMISRHWRGSRSGVKSRKRSLRASSNQAGSRVLLIWPRASVS